MAMNESSGQSVPIMVVKTYLSDADEDGDGKLDREGTREGVWLGDEACRAFLFSLGPPFWNGAN